MKKHLSEEGKYDLVERYNNGESVSKICRESGVPTSTFYTWLKPYKTTTTDSGHVVSSLESIRMESMIEARTESRSAPKSTLHSFVSTSGKTICIGGALWAILVYGYYVRL